MGSLTYSNAASLASERSPADSLWVGLGGAGWGCGGRGDLVSSGGDAPSLPVATHAWPRLERARLTYCSTPPSGERSVFAPIAFWYRANCSGMTYCIAKHRV